MPPRSTSFHGSLRRLLLAGAWLACGPTLASAAPRDVRLIDAGAGSVRFTVEVPAPDLRPVSGHSEWTAIGIEGYEVEARPGEPALVSRVVLVAVPPTGDVSMSFSASAPEWREGVNVMRVPWRDNAAPGQPRGAEDVPVVDPFVDPRSSAGAALPAVRLLEVSWMRDQRVARVAIAPIVYEPARARLGIHRRVEVVLDLRSSTRRGRRPARQRVRERLSKRLGELPAGARLAAQHGRRGRLGRDGGRASGLGGAGHQHLRGSALGEDRDSPAGFYKVQFGQLRNSALFDDREDTPIDSLRLFVWPGVPVLPQDSYCDSCAYREVAIGVVDAGLPGVFDNNDNDYFYFYALGASDWTDLYVGPQDAPQPDTVFLNHPYETRNYYYLTIATAAKPVPGPPQRIDNTQTGALVDTVGAVTPATFTSRVHAEQDREFWPDATPLIGFFFDGSYRRIPEFWEKWFWASISNSGVSQFVEAIALPGLEPSLPTRMRLRVWGLSALAAGAKSPGIFDHHLDVRFGSLAYQGRWNGLLPMTFDTTVTGLSGGGITVEANVVQNPDPPHAAARVDRVGIAWIDAFYPRRFEPVGNALEFASDPAGGKFVYEVGPFTVGPDSIRLFDVTDPYAPLELQVPSTQFALGPSGWFMRFNRVESGRRRYHVLPDYPGDSRIVRPPNSDVVDAPGSNFTNLRRDHSADYLVIFGDPLAAVAESLTTWRHQRLPLPGRSAPYDTMRVPISAIYDQFSGGRTDPGAIRNFLRAAFFNWARTPTFVTILGDASSDFKNFTGAASPSEASAFVPSFEDAFDFVVDRQFATDDWLLNVDHPTQILPDFLGGRIPARDVGSALSYVRDKLLLYERSAPKGEWRDRVMLVADDNEQGIRIDPIYWGHMKQTVDLDVLGLPPEIDRRYVYLHTYSDDVTGESKPEAREAVLRNLSEGVVIFNYIGHGSAFKLADESVFNDSDVELIANQDRSTVLVAASCGVGKFNAPGTTSLGEHMVFSSNAGAVAVISATEEALSSQNATLNLRMFQKVFARDSTTGMFDATLAEGLLVAKTGATTNGQKYQVMGDAAVRLNLPRLSVEVRLEDESGAPVTEVRRGQTIVVRGQVVDRPGGSPMALDGIARLLVEDSAPIDTVPNCFDACFGYPFTAAPMFRGDVTVAAGQFESRFVAPMNAELGLRGRARAYIEVGGGAQATDGVGQSAFPVVQGTASILDRTGPRITLSFVGGSLKVRPDAMLRIDLFDESGVLITGNAPQNGIIITVDDNSAQRYDVTSSFRYAADSYQSGAAYFRLPGLSVGPHRIRVSAADNLASGITAAEHRTPR